MARRVCRLCGQIDSNILLTKNEELLLTLLVRGVRPVDIARQLNLRYSDVKNRLAKVYKKFGVRSATSIIGLVHKQGAYNLWIY